MKSKHNQKAGEPKSELLKSEKLFFAMIEKNAELNNYILQLEKSKKEIEDSNKIFSTVFYKSPVMNSITDATTGKFIEVNENFIKFCGFSKEETIGKSSLELNLISQPEQRIEIIKSIKEKGYSSDVLMEIRNRNGETKWVSTSAYLTNINGQDCFITAMVDVSERTKVKEQLRSANKELEAFTYSVSHDLRAPLRAINGYAKILEEDYSSALDADGKRSLNAILNNSKKMGDLIDDLLAFSRLGRISETPSEINMTALVKTVIEEETIGDSREILFDVQELLPAKGEQVLIKQVWVNLISNAIKYSKYKQKTFIEIGSNSKNNLITYYIKDNGDGFDMKYYDKLFGVFQRLHLQEEFEGTGIGLAIAKKVILRHNGTIWAESKLNEGSCFYFSLPTINF